MDNGFYIVNQLDTISKVPNSIVATIDGATIQTMDAFYNAFSDAFSFPEYFGENTEAFYELINDLDWLNENIFIIIIKDYDKMFVNDLEDKYMCLEMLYQSALEWQSVPNYEGEEEFRNQSIFKIYIEKNTQIVSHLKEMEINENVFIL
ncbi:MAG: barstar family protein [Bacteroidota bacterium]